jgi:hypothetical protein
MLKHLQHDILKSLEPKLHVKQYQIKENVLMKSKFSVLIFMVVTVQVGVFWVVTPCSPERGYSRFGGTCCLIFLD